MDEAAVSQLSAGEPRALAGVAQPPSPQLAAGFRKIGEELTADWLKKAGPDGQAILDAYKRSVGTN